MNFYNVIIRPVVTEKGVAANAAGKHTFLVHADSTKIDVKNAIESLYGTSVTDVNIAKVQKKVRLVGRGKVMTKRKAYKKAIVTLKDKKSVFDPLKIKLEK